MSLVAVYGSLKKGFGNHRLLSNARYLGTESTQCIYTMYSMGPFPCVVPGGNTGIDIEVYEVDDHVLATLDMLEGHPDFYKRVRIPTAEGWAWMYVIDAVMEGTPVVASGVWT